MKIINNNQTINNVKLTAGNTKQIPPIAGKLPIKTYSKQWSTVKQHKQINKPSTNNNNPQNNTLYMKTSNRQHWQHHNPMMK